MWLHTSATSSMLCSMSTTEQPNRDGISLMWRASVTASSLPRPAAGSSRKATTGRDATVAATSSTRRVPTSTNTIGWSAGGSPKKPMTSSIVAASMWPWA